MSDENVKNIITNEKNKMNEKVDVEPVTATVEVADHTGHTTLQLTKQETIKLAGENSGHWIFADGQLVNAEGLNQVNWKTIDKVRLVPGLVGGGGSGGVDESNDSVVGDTNGPKSPAILLVGAGGIGSLVIELLVPALERCNTRCQIDIMDDDLVEETNLGHQKFTFSDIGLYKVDALANRFNDAKNIVIDPITERLTQGSQLEYYDLVIVAVDNSTPRKIVHDDANAWLDLRCRGDGWLLLDSNTDSEIISSLSPDHKPTSCQIEGALDNGNIEFGFAAVAAAGAQWIFQFIRQYYGENTMTPSAQMSSLTHGVLALPLPSTKKTEVVA